MCLWHLESEGYFPLICDSRWHMIAPDEAESEIRGGKVRSIFQAHEMGDIFIYIAHFMGSMRMVS